MVSRCPQAPDEILIVAEPGPAGEVVELHFSVAYAIDWQKRSALYYEYPSDARALDDFIVCQMPITPDQHPSRPR